MGDSERRITLQGAEPSVHIRFAPVLRAVTAAFAPPRLILGLLLVAALMTAGRIWDGFTRPTVSPDGLLAGEITEAQRERLSGTLEDALRRFGIEPGGVRTDSEGALDPDDVLDRIARSCREQREEAGADQARREALDASFRTTAEAIRSALPRSTFDAAITHVVDSFNGLVKGLLSLRLDGCILAAEALFVHTPVAVWRHDPWFAVVYGLIALVLVALGGGALSRMAAAEFARDEKIGVPTAVTFALRSWRRLVFSLLLPLALAAILAGVLLLGGWFLMLPWLDILGGLLYGAALIVGFVVVFLLVGYALGFPLLLSAVACENCDAGDALQRAYAYVLGRPLHYVGYAALGVAGLAAGYVVANFMAALVLNVTGALVDAATASAAVEARSGFRLFDLGLERADASTAAAHVRGAAALVDAWQTVVVCLVAAYVFANFFGASTIAYLLLRRAIEGQEVTEIWEPGMVPGTMASEVGAADDEVRDAER